MEIFTVAFFGHRYIDNPFRIEERLEEHIYRLLAEKEYVDFLVGHDGEFDSLHPLQCFGYGNDTGTITAPSF